MIKIRPIKNQDFDQITQIEFDSFTEPYSKDLFQYLALSSHELFLVAVEEGKFGEIIQGYAVAEIDEYEEARLGHILSIAVGRQYRGKGLGNALLSELLDVLKSKRCIRIILEVKISNYVAKALYEKRGFREVRRRRKYYRNGEDAVIMALDV